MNALRLVLVHYNQDKEQIMEKNKRKFVLNEKDIQLNIASNFMVNLVATFKAVTS